MRRDTTITLYKTRRIDATYQNIWAFFNKEQRNAWLTSKPYMIFSNCKYWKYGEPIKVEIPFTDAFDYDYVKITNNSSSAEDIKEYYCFITNRAYISDNVTIFYLDVDIVQTWYFDSDGRACWTKNAMIAKSTATINPPRGTANDFPQVVPFCQNFIGPLRRYGIVLYSTVNLADLDNLTYQTAIIDGQYTAAPPYVMKADNTSEISSLITKLNNKGLTDAISGIYLFPLDYCNESSLSYTPVLPSESFYKNETITIPKETEIQGYTPVNNVLLGYDYTYITVNNGCGEVIKYNFEDFNGNPMFDARLCLAGGYPSIVCTPLNYAEGEVSESRQRTQKITVPVSCSYLNDSYKIWLAQSQNSRQAALNQSAEAIRQAEYAKSASYAANLSEPVYAVEDYARGLIGKATDKIEQFGDFFSGGFFGGKKESKNENAQSLSMTDVADTLTDIGIAYINRQLGIETAYQYDFNVKNAQLAQNALFASYKDRAAVPAQATGSNAYGDMTALGQYGFMFAVYTPTREYAEWIDKTLSAAGHTVNKWGLMQRYHKKFDYYKCASVQLFADESRPEFARYHIISIINNGVYMWYYDEGDISPAIGIPYNLPNEVI